MSHYITVLVNATVLSGFLTNWNWFAFNLVINEVFVRPPFWLLNSICSNCSPCIGIVLWGQRSCSSCWAKSALPSEAKEKCWREASDVWGLHCTKILSGESLAQYSASSCVMSSECPFPKFPVIYDQWFWPHTVDGYSILPCGKELRWFHFLASRQEWNFK